MTDTLNQLYFKLLYDVNNMHYNIISRYQVDQQLLQPTSESCCSSNK